MNEPRAPRRSLAVRLIEARSRKPFGEIIGKKRAEGKSWRQIGAEYGVSWMTVWRHWKDWEEENTGARPTR
jgi:hypothetical protein